MTIRETCCIVILSSAAGQAGWSAAPARGAAKLVGKRGTLSMLVGPTIRRRRLGTELRRLRESRSLRLQDVASSLGVAPSTVSRIETGNAPTRTSYLTVMLELYGVADPADRRALIEMARQGQRKGWWAASEELLAPGFGRYLGLEAEASALRVFQAQVVPGLLQTPEYAAAVITAARPDLVPEQVERLVAVQVRRQEVLRGIEPTQLALIVDESVLLRGFGSAQVMRCQLEYLLAASRRLAVTVQVLRLSGCPRPVLSGSFAILSFAWPADPEVASAEGIRGQILAEERPVEVQALASVFAALSHAALTPAESADLVSDLAGGR
jgi:transcriptional regulator with XRE-family HTH domain